VLAAWDRRFDLDSRGAALFREFWRIGAVIPGVWRVALDPADRVGTPHGLKLADAEVAGKVWAALGTAAQNLRRNGLAPDTPLSAVQRTPLVEPALAEHGGTEGDGVLNLIGSLAAPALTPRGWTVDYGTSYAQTVRFDSRGPVANALLAYGQSSEANSGEAHAALRRFAEKRWPRLPFHADEIARERVGEVLRLVRP
jgi:acyl-homoserine-lactone acylase